MPYVYEEGVVPVPARRCTRCGGALTAPAPGQEGDFTGWFEVSTLDEGTWLFATKEEPESGTAEVLACSVCGRTFRLYATSRSLRHP